MRPLLAFALLPWPALAHTGHLGALSGHDHWVAGAAIGIAAGIALWQLAKDRKARRAREDEAEAGERPA